ncbi:hypothetical protein V8F20_003203 [Naviculisporaceae sp. PSN 640]
MSFKWPPAKDRPLKKYKEARLAKDKKTPGSFAGSYGQEKKEEASLFSAVLDTAEVPKEPGPSSSLSAIGHAAIGQIPYHDPFRDPPATSDRAVEYPAPPMLPSRQPSPPRLLPQPYPTMRFDALRASSAQSTHPSQPLEFIGSKPAVEGRDPSSHNRSEKPSEYIMIPPRGLPGFGSLVAQSSLQNNKKAPVERRRSDSQGKASLYRSSSPVSLSSRPSPSPTNGTSASDERVRALPPRPGSNDSRNEQPPSDPAKKDSASILDELMQRYERKEADMRKTHEKELRKLQKEHAQMVDKLKEELSATKLVHAQETEKLKQERQTVELNWQNTYMDLMQHKKEKDQTSMEKAKQEAELQLERQEKERLLAESNAKYEAMDKKTRTQIDGLERDVRALKGHYENQVARLTDQYEDKLRKEAEMRQKEAHGVKAETDHQVAEMRKQMAELNARLAAQTEEMNKLNSQKEGLQRDVETLKEHCNELQARYSLQREEAAKREETLAKEINMVKDQYRMKLKDIQNDGEKHMAVLQERLQHQEVVRIHELEMREAKVRDEMERMRRDHDQRLATATLDLRQRILSLESDLIDNGDDLRPSLGGGALQTRYRELKLKVETVTEPFNLGEITSPAGFDTSELDQREFLAREGKSQMRFLLRSVCWSVILDRFFSSPFGFGAFGREEGKKMLLEVYATWQRLFDPSFTGFISAPELSGQEDFEPFYNDKFANWWRSATFQSIQSIVFPSRRASTGPLDENGAIPGPQGIVKAFTDNVEMAKTSVLDLITKVCKADKVSEEIESEVDGLVRCASQLAVEFGAHGAKICFGMPTFGDTVQIGAEFVDCEDGDSNRGKLETVELAVAPSLFMIGDGRKDLTTATCLYPGEIYPRRGD